jgi:DNA sulfur modification protein DndD
LIINRIILENFKVYEGKQIIDLSINQSSKQMVIIGGHNGAGKTTIIHCVKLCLYGQKANQLQINYKSYNSLLSSFHNKNDIANGGNQFGVSVQFQVNDIGFNSLITIKRSWILKTNGKYKENLNIERDGKEIQFISPEFWQDYIYRISPLGLAELLYFDSEDYRNIPNYFSNGFIESLRKLFDISSSHDLSKDIEKYIIHRGGKYDKDLHDELESFEETFLNQLNRVDAQNEKLNTLKISLNDKRMKKIILENKLSKTVGEIGLKKDKLISKKEELIHKIKHDVKEYEEICSKYLPFHIARDVSAQFIVQLNNEREIKTNNILLAKLEQIEELFFKHLNYSPQNKLYDELKKAWTKAISIDQYEDNVLLDISKTLSDKFINHLNTCIGDTLLHLKNNRLHYRRNIQSRDRINRDLKQINAAGPSGKLYSELTNISNEIGQIQSQIDQTNEKLDEHKKRLEYIELKIGVGQRKLSEKAKSEEKVKYASSVIKILNEYSKILAIKKFKTIKIHFLDILSKLSTKGDIIQNIELTPDGNNLLFYGRNGLLLNLNELSAGESELVALSTLWAIHKTSGSNHPIITDSPFNRLDEDHRHRIIEHFIKPLKSQLIFLSTDKEIQSVKDYNLVDVLGKTLSIEYNHNTKSSHIKDGYFKTNK